MTGASASLALSQKAKYWWHHTRCEPNTTFHHACEMTVRWLQAAKIRLSTVYADAILSPIKSTCFLDISLLNVSNRNSSVHSVPCFRSPGLLTITSLSCYVMLCIQQVLGRNPGYEVCSWSTKHLDRTWRQSYVENGAPNTPFSLDLNQRALNCTIQTKIDTKFFTFHPCYGRVRQNMWVYI